MGYRSNVSLKTTTEGWIIIQKVNNSIKDAKHRFLNIAQVQCTPTGFYKITFEDIKWYEGSYEEVDKFITARDELDENDIPYSFIRIGEEVDDIEFRQNYTDDMPDEIACFEPVVDVNDDDWGSYEDVVIS